MHESITTRVPQQDNSDHASHEDTSLLRRHVLRRLKSLEGERSTWESLWKNLAKHFCPQRSRFLSDGAQGHNQTNRGTDRENKRLFDGTGRLAVRTLAAGMQSGLTSPSRPWFQLEFVNSGLKETEEARAWVERVYGDMLAVFSGSNFYEQAYTLYSELATFGTGGMLAEDDDVTVVRFRTLTAGEYFLHTDDKGRVDTLYRRVAMTARQIAEAWPDTCPDTIRQAAERDDAAWINVIHAVEPNPEKEEGAKRGSKRPWRSVYMLEDEGGADAKDMLEVSGYYEFPAMCPRWEVTASDVYGSSPAMDALSDCRMLQRLAKDGLEALEMEVKPPLNVSTGGNEPVDISPAALNYLPPAAVGQQAVMPLYQVRANLAGLQSYIAGYQNQIKETLYSNLFLMLSGMDKSMTATEVNERNAEKMLMIGPVIDRLWSEFLQPLMARVWGIMDRRGMIPAPPGYLQGEQLDVTFVSILAQAQRRAGLSDIQETGMIIGQFAQMDPGALDKLNTDRAIEHAAKKLGTMAIIRSEEQVAEIRAQREEQQQQMKQMAMMQQGMDMLSKGAGAINKAGMPGDMPMGMPGGMEQAIGMGNEG